jgi:16S rRNA (guanine527-N7)-methyltransferase
VDAQHLAELLQPFLSRIPRPGVWNSGSREPEINDTETSSKSDALSTSQIQPISTYIDLLLRWNSRINLTAVREPREIVTRHFGESLFAARCLFPRAQTAAGRATPPTAGALPGGPLPENHPQAPAHVVDLGSGAGFPGLPIKIWAPHVHLTLVESNFKKATFLREVVRSLGLTGVQVAGLRAEDFTVQADVVTLRAVEHFKTILPTAARLVTAYGRLAVFIGEGQVKLARELTPGFQWGAPIPIPQSSNRVLMIGSVPG